MVFSMPFNCLRGPTSSLVLNRLPLTYAVVSNGLGFVRQTGLLSINSDYGTRTRGPVNRQDYDNDHDGSCLP